TPPAALPPSSSRIARVSRHRRGMTSSGVCVAPARLSKLSKLVRVWRTCHATVGCAAEMRHHVVPPHPGGYNRERIPRTTLGGLSMPRAIPVAIREQLCQRHRSGEPTAPLAAAYGVSPRAARALCRRLRRGGLKALRPRSHAPPAPPHAKPPACRADLIQLRRDHPTWR